MRGTEMRLVQKSEGSAILLGRQGPERLPDRPFGLERLLTGQQTQFIRDRPVQHAGSPVFLYRKIERQKLATVTRRRSRAMPSSSRRPTRR